MRSTPYAKRSHPMSLAPGRSSGRAMRTNIRVVKGKATCGIEHPEQGLSYFVSLVLDRSEPENRALEFKEARFRKAHSRFTGGWPTQSRGAQFDRVWAIEWGDEAARDHSICISSLHHRPQIKSNSVDGIQEQPRPSGAWTEQPGRYGHFLFN